MKQNKLKIEVFLPFGSCAGSFAALMEKVGNVASRFKDKVEVQTKSTNSKEAREYGIQGACVIVNSSVRLPADFKEIQLEDAIIKSVSKQ